MYTLVIPLDNELDISCKLFMYNDTFFPLPVVLYFCSDNDLEKNMKCCSDLSLESVCHVIMITNMDLINYKKFVIRLIDFVCMEMEVDVTSLILLGRRWATNIVTYALYYCYDMFGKGPYSLVLVYPERHDIESVTCNLSYCKKTVVLFIDDDKHDYSDYLKDYINNISILDFPTYTNYISEPTSMMKDIILPIRYVIRPIYISKTTQYKLPKSAKFVSHDIIYDSQPNIINIVPKLYKKCSDRISSKYAEIKKLLS